MFIRIRFLRDKIWIHDYRRMSYLRVYIIYVGMCCALLPSHFYLPEHIFSLYTISCSL